MAVRLASITSCMGLARRVILVISIMGNELLDCVACSFLWDFRWVKTFNSGGLLCLKLYWGRDGWEMLFNFTFLRNFKRVRDFDMRSMMLTWCLH